MALLLDHPLGRCKDALQLEKAAYKVYRELIGERHELTAQVREKKKSKKDPDRQIDGQR